MSLRLLPRSWLALSFLLAAAAGSGKTLYVSLKGDDRNPGTKGQPFATLAGARDWLRTSGFLGHEPVMVEVASGDYRLPEPIRFDSRDSGTAQAPVVYTAGREQTVVLNGGTRLALAWTPYRDGIMVAPVPAGLTTDQLFVNGVAQRLARYPNFDPKQQYLGGGAADVLSAERARRWAHPEGGIVHGLDKYLWGDFHYVITGKAADGTVTYTGGWQTNRPSPLHPQYRYVENIFEELDAPGEWFLDAKSNRLYFYPPAGLALAQATIDGVRLKSLVEFHGTQAAPVRFITLRGFTFEHTARTFMETKEPLMRSDWAIYRGGAILFDGAEDCVLEHARVEGVGGNAVFVNGYNRRVRIRDSVIEGAGASGVLFVGDPSSVRSPLFSYSGANRFKDLDLTPGPRNDLYPMECSVEDCLIHDTGREEKQSAGVEIEIARRISVLHCSIYDLPRSGINIGDGAFGGDVIDGCDVFDTVKETGDHGSFNAWGRDRYWRLKDGPSGEKLAALSRLDAIEPNVIRNSRWRCDNGWDIDLDDGSSNYEIYNNVLLHGGLKLREGFYRIVSNNVIINNSLHPHVWFEASHDVFTHNIVMGRYRPALMKVATWGDKVDENFFTTNEEDRTAFGAQGADAHSLSAPVLFRGPVKGDFGVESDSPALLVGFRNFPMDQFGVQASWLRFQAKRPEIPRLRAASTARAQAVFKWEGAELRELAPGEFSAVGVPEGAGGVILSDVPPYVEAAHAGLQTDDFVEAVNGHGIKNADEFGAALQALPQGQPVTLLIRRHQMDATVTVSLDGLPKLSR